MGRAQNAIDPVTGLMTAYPGGPLEILFNNTKWNGERINGVDANGRYTFETRSDFSVYIPGFGPPRDYNTFNTRALGGNPDIAAVAGGKPAYLKGTPATATSRTTRTTR